MGHAGARAVTALGREAHIDLLRREVYSATRADYIFSLLISEHDTIASEGLGPIIMAIGKNRLSPTSLQSSGKTSVASAWEP